MCNAGVFSLGLNISQSTCHLWGSEKVVGENWLAVILKDLESIAVVLKPLKIRHSLILANVLRNSLCLCVHLVSNDSKIKLSDSSTV